MKKDSLAAIEDIKKEHDQIRSHLSYLKAAASEESQIVLDTLWAKIMDLYELWAEHETAEQKLFTKLTKVHRTFPIGKMDIAHKELRGHWKVILKALVSKDSEKIRVALDTDGGMFADKLQRHMDTEEALFSKYFK